MARQGGRHQQGRAASWLEQLNRRPSQGRDGSLGVGITETRAWLAENSLAANYHSVGIEMAFRK
jgi:hypothetical protein